MAFYAFGMVFSVESCILLLASFACARKWRVVGLVGSIAQNDGAADEMGYAVDADELYTCYQFIVVFQFPRVSHTFYFLDWSSVKCLALNVVCPLSAVCVLWLMLIVYLPEWSSL